MARRTDAADTFDDEYRLLEVLRFGYLLDAPVVIADPDIDVDDLLAVNDELPEFRLLLERMVWPYRNGRSITHAFLESLFCKIKSFRIG